MLPVKFSWIPVLLLSLFVGACTAEVEEEGELPQAEIGEGDVPNTDVDPANIDVDLGRDTVIVPDIDVEVTRDTTP